MSIHADSTNRLVSDLERPISFYRAGFLLGLTALCSFAATGDQLWRFYADYGVTVVVPTPDLSGTGGKDVLVGSQDDSLYLVEGKGPKAGNQLWAAPFQSTLSSASFLPDVNGDGMPDAVGGDELGLMQVLSGSNGQALWTYLTFGTVLSLLSVADANGDGIGDVAAGSENDTVYCFSGKPAGVMGKVLWKFGFSGAKIKPLVTTPSPKTASLVPASKNGASGANTLAQLNRKSGGVFGIAVGTNVDTVYCLALANGAPLWKRGLPGDIWEIKAFPDQDGDGIEEVLAACGADIAYLLHGSTGEIIWSHSVSLGAISVAVSEDADGDGKHDALIGDGGGKVHCVSGAAKGAGVAAIWIYDFGDTSSILSLAPMGDLDNDGKPDCAVGTSNDLTALLNGKGGIHWSRNLGGTVNAVADIGDVDGDGSADVGAGSLLGFVSALGGGGPSAIKSRRSLPLKDRRVWRMTMGQPDNGLGMVLREGDGRVYFDVAGRNRSATLANWGIDAGPTVSGRSPERLETEQ